MEKIVLAYSGGLDTSVILKWLTLKGFEVICFIGDVGQNEDFEKIKEKAIKTGASKVYIVDLKKEFVTDYIFYAIKANAVYEGRYLLGTALARPILAKAQIDIAKKEGAKFVSHGATGKGNDQVRFELSYFALYPEIKVFSPWKDEEFLSKFDGRPKLIEFAKQHGIDVKATSSKPYSEDENLMHISHEAGILEDPNLRAPEHVYSMTNSVLNAPDIEDIIKIEFSDGVPIKVINEKQEIVKEDPLELFIYLNELGKKHGIGRLDMVENRLVGIKSRGIYETPGATILLEAHRDLEGIAMDREVMHIRDMLIPKFSEIIYNGYWFSPEMDFLMNAINKSQEAIDGIVTLSLLKGNVYTIGRESKTSLYNQNLSSMDVEGGFNAIDSKGFINTNATRLKAHNVVIGRKPYFWRKNLNEGN